MVFACWLIWRGLRIEQVLKSVSSKVDERRLIEKGCASSSAYGLCNSLPKETVPLYTESSIALRYDDEDP